ncbi:MAG: ADP-ribosylglycohydrolase family protein [Muribaculaceae bacterium]|nr:ADP-ribosylglycohydrolase family protein [Muribaculaceae bacterium]
MTTTDKARGSLFGGAIGDALGYEVEFSSLNSILARYGQPGITDYALDSKGVARFSDDTQMTLFTAEGILSAYQANPEATPDEIISSIKEAYLAWFDTQTAFQLPLPYSWLTHVRDLWARRAPGNTCLSALSQLKDGYEVKNTSKGCGGVMRIAPIGIFYAAHAAQCLKHNSQCIMDFVARVAAGAANITHKHAMSDYSSAFVALLVYRCILEKDTVTRSRLRAITEECLPIAIGVTHSDHNSKRFEELIREAMKLAESDTDDFEAIRCLGEGWIAEETAAIALFSVMRYIDDFERCVVCAVNHDGDSDSTGAVAGNIIGAILGYDAIPEKYKKNLELADVIVSIADDLAGVAGPAQMSRRYADHRPYGIDEKLNFISGMKFTPENITELGPDDIFVFGSNLAGHHAGGAARVARRRFGAIEGQGVGMQGQCYAIPTMQGGVETIKPYVDDFIEVASNCDQNTFYVTRIGCGIAGFTDEEIAPLFREALKLYNVRLPESFVRILLNQ